ncbi:MAG TPA: thiamine pyrophosphate-binding protein [Stellaceae bacterium]|jgi:acetolactate synthase-1/2/3 large subunit|nr:thiamine pyrophosphate-binding protein [Stellaceae bacterium]
MSDKATMNGAEWLAQALASTGMSHVFFVESTMRRTLLALGDHGVKPILAHSEKAAAYMADGYARVAGRPGVCMAQSVGAANLASGLQDAWLGRSPVIAFTGHKEPSYQHRNSYQEIPHAPLFSAVTKFSSPVYTTQELPRLLRHAWRSALADTVRPTHLDFNGLQGDVIELGQTSASTEIDADKRPIPVHRPVADDRDIERAINLVKGESRVCIVAGDGAAASGAGAEVLALAEALAAPVATSLGARGIIPTTHRLAAGVVGSYSAPPANRIVHSADLVLYIGCDTGDQVTLNWTVPSINTKIVQIDIDPTEIGRSYPNTTGIVGDPKVTVARLNQMLGRPNRDGAFVEEAARIMADWREGMRALCERNTGPVTVERLCTEITNALPADGIIVADTGYSGIWTGTMVDFNGAGQTYLRAAGSLGWAFPASLGAKCAAGDRKVICFTGDGGFYYHLPELESAKRYNIGTVVVVNNNSGFGQNLTGVNRISGNRPGRGEELIRFGPTDFTKVAESLGVRGIRVERPEQIGPALKEALAANAPVVVDVVTQLEPRAPEQWVPPAA